MERNELKQLLDTMEERTIHILELTELMDILANDSIIDEASKYFYLITDILHKECDRLDIERAQLKIACLD